MLDTGTAMSAPVVSAQQQKLSAQSRGGSGSAELGDLAFGALKTLLSDSQEARAIYERQYNYWH